MNSPSDLWCVGGWGDGEKETTNFAPGVYHVITEAQISGDLWNLPYKNHPKFIAVEGRDKMGEIRLMYEWGGKSVNY